MFSSGKKRKQSEESNIRQKQPKESVSEVIDQVAVSAESETASTHRSVSQICCGTLYASKSKLFLHKQDPSHLRLRSSKYNNESAKRPVEDEGATTGMPCVRCKEIVIGTTGRVFISHFLKHSASPPASHNPMRLCWRCPKSFPNYDLKGYMLHAITAHKTTELLSEILSCKNSAAVFDYLRAGIQTTYGAAAQKVWSFIHDQPFPCLPETSKHILNADLQFENSRKRIIPTSGNRIVRATAISSSAMAQEAKIAATPPFPSNYRIINHRGRKVIIAGKQKESSCAVVKESTSKPNLLFCIQCRYKIAEAQLLLHICYHMNRAIHRASAKQDGAKSFFDFGLGGCFRCQHEQCSKSAIWLSNVGLAVAHGLKEHKTFEFVKIFEWPAATGGRLLLSDYLLQFTEPCFGGDDALRVRDIITSAQETKKVKTELFQSDCSSNLSTVFMTNAERPELSFDSPMHALNLMPSLSGTSPVAEVVVKQEPTEDWSQCLDSFSSEMNGAPDDVKLEMS